MPKISEVYAGQFVNAVELPQGRRITAVITAAVAQTVGQGELANLRVVLDLCSVDGRNWPKQLVMNKTNSTMIAAVYGDDTANWLNRQVEVWREKTMYAGRLVDAIRMSAAASPPPQTAPAAAPPSPPAGNSGAIAMPGPVQTPPAASPTMAYAPIPGAAPPLAQPRQRVVFPDGAPAYDKIPGGAGGPDDLDDAIPF